jgi:hypothetical protein
VDLTIGAVTQCRHGVRHDQAGHSGNRRCAEQAVLILSFACRPEDGENGTKTRCPDGPLSKTIGLQGE